MTEKAFDGGALGGAGTGMCDEQRHRGEHGQQKR
jgi:hypothetical protein